MTQTVVAIDVGGTKVLAGLVDRDCNVICRSEVPTPLERTEDVLDVFVRLVDTLRDDSTVAVGFSTLTLVSSTTDALGFPGRVPLEGVRLRPWATERFGLPVAVENDGNAAALAESQIGAGRGAAHQIVLVFGTGVGGGLILDGRLYRGFGGVAGELGQITVDRGPDGPLSLEQVASGLALDARAEAIAKDQPDSDVATAVAGGSTADARLLIALAETGDGAARRAVQEIGALMGVGVCSLVDVFNPQLVVLGGGVFAAGTQLLDAIRDSVAERVLPPARDEVSVVRAELGPAAGMLGAALAAFAAAPATELHRSQRLEMG